MNVLYDHQAFSIQNYGGISRYHYELFKNFCNNEKISPQLIIKVSNNEYLHHEKNLLPEYRSFLSDFEFKGKKVLMELINTNHILKKIRSINFDVFHPTYYNPYFLNKIQDKPFVITVHDMNHELFSDQFDIYDNAAANKKIITQKASKVIAVSQNTKKDLMQLYNIPGEKIKVIYHGYNQLPDKNAEIELPKNYFLYVGNRSRYKNFGFLVQALQPFLIKNNFFLISAGGGSFNKKEQKILNRLNLNQKVIHYKINDEILAILYRNAYAFIFPSLYEGFGMPILEAFSKNCPVLASNCSSLPEIAGDAALYFDPNKLSSLQEAINTIAEDYSLRNALVDKGIKKLKNFSWQKTATETAQVYKEIAT